MSAKKMSITKPIVSITEICEMLQLSRSRYYQLVDSGFFPKPLRDEKSKRPYYDAALQKQILEARKTGIGVDGSFMLFYSPRKNESSRPMFKKKKQADPVAQELADILAGMGVEAAFEEVQKALNKLYPDGTEGMDQGIVTRELYRYFKQMK
ncbi:hypothetical protein STSP2_03253 [Anaerohalosphaera lusitana]|uniref:Uncharacterized protein n=1 Tax=Anaerohalosphaera lusitana TaxID=1936003 RepID=A0A1U9NQ39_9BACT|nr:AlpA family phage regulatory protein [Anaerohalosphaera lusitana]AQT70051.1 hypothetical protein STSP2_03253 [Anaerohalosphaera lusitana]